MLTYNLFNKVLIEPATNKPVTRLQIISGFATPSIAKKHMERLADLNRPIHIELIIGMPKDYINEKQHKEFCDLTKNTKTNVSISCKYITKGIPVHAKTYCWSFGDGQPSIAFAGSANYTMTAFGMSRDSQQKEAMAYVNASTVQKFHDELKKDAIDCTSPEALNHIKKASYQKPAYKRYSFRPYFRYKNSNYRPYRHRKKSNDCTSPEALNHIKKASYQKPAYKRYSFRPYFRYKNSNYRPYRHRKKSNPGCVWLIMAVIIIFYVTFFK